jgi:large subunit ribosomal protein L6
MSRIGRQPIPLPKGVEVAIHGSGVAVKGPKGEITEKLPPGITAEVREGQVLCRRRDDSKHQKACHGLSRALLANAVHGVTEGFVKHLEIHGVGYRAEVRGKVVVFTLGYTHPIEFPVPEGIQVTVERNTRLRVSGVSRQQVGQVAAEIRALRPPDVYKHKGVRYEGELLLKKAGKTGASA